MALTGHFVTKALKAQRIHELTLSQLAQARLIESQIEDALLTGRKMKALENLAHRFGKACGCRISIIDPEGKVLGDSDISFERLPQVENQMGRPEVRAALGGRDGWDVRYSNTVGVHLLYVAVPIYGRNEVKGVVRLALPLTQVHQKVSAVRQTMIWIAFWMILVASGVALLLSWSVARPVKEMAQVAERLVQGDYEARVGALPPDEHGELGKTLNRLGERVESTIQELSREKSELALILSTMVEAVVAVDAGNRVLTVNSAFSRLFDMKPDEAQGRPFYEVLRQAQLAEVLRCALRECKGSSEEVILFTPEERIFEANALPLIRDGKAGGAILVLHDITRSRRLEQMRRDFVANVSHELRTPLTSICGSVETLLSGAMEDSAARLDFLQSIQQDASRLVRLVEDLLDLSAIESGKRSPKLEPLILMEVAQEAVSGLKNLAARHNVTVELESANNIPQIQADREQLRRVFVNLLDNAIKFNKEGGKVRISAVTNGRSVTVSVEDTGTGIATSDLPRIFERFYRVDKARSREMGGSGLGLSIVKHIVEAHGGSVAVESKEGEGSTFRFTLPLPTAELGLGAVASLRCQPPRLASA